MRKISIAILSFLITSSFSVVGAIADEALEAFQTAKDAFEDGQYLEAARLFRKAYDAKPTWKLLYNMGQAEAAAKRYGLALEAFEQYIAEGGDEISQSRQSEMHAEIGRLRDMVGILEIKTHDGAKISIDGVYRGTAPVHGGIPVSAGVEHSVEVELDGESLSKETVRILGGRTVKLTILSNNGETSVDDINGSNHGDPLDGGEKGSEATNDDAASGKRAVGITVVAVGASLLAGGVVAGGISLAKNGDLRDNCVNGICPKGFEDTERTRNITGITSAALLGTGTIAIVAGVLVLVKIKDGQTRVGVHPIIGPTTAGASLTLAF